MALIRGYNFGPARGGSGLLTLEPTRSGMRGLAFVPACHKALGIFAYLPRGRALLLRFRVVPAR
jgi:hypothetical protein